MKIKASLFDKSSPERHRLQSVAWIMTIGSNLASNWGGRGWGRELESRLVRKHKQKLRGPLLLLTRGMTYVTACVFFFRRQSEKKRRRRRRCRCSSDRFFGRLLSADKAAKMRHGGYGRTTISQRDPACIFRISFFSPFCFWPAPDR